MKTLFIEALKKQKINDIDFSKLPSKIILAYSIQYKPLADEIKKKLGKRIKWFQQVLGCTELKGKYPIFLVGSGKFHALQLALQGNQVYILEGNEIVQLDSKEIEKLKTNRKTALIKFLTANMIGILVSTKPGQENLKKAEKLKKQLEKKHKEAFIFIGDNLNIGELENYNIESWVNTACPALTSDSRVVNLAEILSKA